VSTVYLGIGSNVDTQANIGSGIAALRDAFGDISLSPVYRSAAVGFAGNDFVNLVAGIRTHMQPLELKEFLNQLEDRHGRLRDVPKFSDRTLDIDILMFDDLYLHCPGLILPRPEILDYAHVLRPLADLAPQLVHPVRGKSLGELWSAFGGDRGGLETIDFPA
jgi:2-amino-4-hydroxy-6-hydroxymethyldihydropteridine diphosphokinase